MRSTSVLEDLPDVTGQTERFPMQTNRGTLQFRISTTLNACAQNKVDFLLLKLFDSVPWKTQ